MRTHQATRLAMAALVLASVAVPVRAQAPGSPRVMAHKGCRGRSDGAGCGLRFQPDFSAYIGTSLTGRRTAEWRAGVGAGLTYSVGARSSIGLSLQGLTHGGSTLSLLVRYRRWLDPVCILDVTAGAYLTGNFNSSRYEGNIAGINPIGELGVSFGDWFALTGRLERLHLRGDPRIYPGSLDGIVFLAGGRMGKALGWVGYVATLATYIVAAASLSS